MPKRSQGAVSLPRTSVIEAIDPDGASVEINRIEVPILRSAMYERPFYQLRDGRRVKLREGVFYADDGTAYVPSN